MKNRFKIWFAFVALMIGFVGVFPVFGQIQTLEDGSTIFPIHGGRNLVQLDPWGRLEGVLNSRGGLTTFSYNDPAGNIAWRQNGEGELTEYGYDTMNRLVAVTNESVEVAVYDHDNNGNVVLSENGNASVATGYDSLNRLSSSTQTVGSVDFVVNNTFDLNGNRTGITYPGGLSVSYNYGADNRLDGITTTYGGNNKNITFGYDTANRLTGVTYPNGVNSTYGYDAESRVTSIQHGSFVDRTIHRNELGFKTTEVVDAGTKPTVPGTARRIKSHNDADQLVSEQVQQGTNWTDIVYSYTDNGGLASVQSAKSVDYTYDYDNRLVTVDDASSFIEYIYDASGSRIGRIDGTTVTYFVVDYADGLKRPLAETDDQGNITRFYVWSGSHLICHIEVNGTTRYYHADELGSTLALTDDLGNITDEFAYMPYGYATHTPHANSTDTPFQWLGGYGVYYDSDTDLHLTLHRAYSSKLKRFISPDPLGIDGGVNVYAMANRNPLAFIDPYGLEAGSATRSELPWYEKMFNKIDDWLYEDEQNRTANRELGNALAYDYMNNPKYAEARGWHEGLGSVADKLAVATVVHGGYQALGNLAGTSALAPKSGSAALSPFRNTRAGETFQHYSYGKHADSLSGGLRSGGYATTTKGLTGSQAKSGLSLRHPTTPNAVYTVTPPAGTSIRVNPITRPQFGQPGGLPEVEFLFGTPPGSVSGPFPLP